VTFVFTRVSLFRESKSPVFPVATEIVNLTLCHFGQQQDFSGNPVSGHCTNYAIVVMGM